MVLMQREIKKVYMWKTPVKMDKWPCPDGFHVPSFNDAEALIDAMSALWLNSASSWRSYLKIVAGGRLSINWTIELSSGYSWLWTTWNMGGGSPDSYYLIMVRDWYWVVWPSSWLWTAYWLNIRPFKDTPVVPDSSWTALYSNRIYWNSTLGLISVSSDGTNWITIADKNAWAENVGDIGRYYQRWNNYWFPQSGFDTSSTQVDVSDYGDTWVAYSSSTFITWSNSWMVSIKDSLWNYNYWWDIQIRPVIQDIYVDLVLVGWWGWGGWAYSRDYSWGWWGGGWVIMCCNYFIGAWSYEVVIWAWGCWGIRWLWCYWWNGWNSTFNWLTAKGWWWWGWACAVWTSWASWWWWGTVGTYAWWSWTQWCAGWTGTRYWAWGWWGFCENWYNTCNRYCGWNWWQGTYTCMTWSMMWFSWGWGWWSYRNYAHWSWGVWWGTLAATCYWGWWGWGQTCCWNNCCWYAGCQWVFILRYPTACEYCVSWGNCVYTCGDYTIHCFTSNGTLKVWD